MDHQDPLGLLSEPALTSRSSVIRDLLEHAKRPGVISLAGGIPDPDLFPMARIRAAVDDALASGPDVLQYGLTPGEADARAVLSTLMERPVDVDRVVVTTGSQQGLDLLTKVLCDPGDEIIVGDPAYLGALQVFRSHRCALRPVPVDEAGLVVDAVADHLGGGGPAPAFVYTVANFDNPTGATLSAPRRAQLAALAERHGFLVVEDDPYGALRYDGVAPSPLGEDSEHVVRLRSTSKVLAPGLRIGWLEAPRWLVAAIVIAKQSADLHTSTLSQAVVARLLEDATWYGDHLDRLRVQYRSRRDALAGALTDTLGARCRFVVPDGGMFLWATIEGVSSGALLAGALEQGVAFVPGDAFAIEADASDALRLSFATADPDELAEACRRLGRAVDMSAASIPARVARPRGGR